MLFEEMWLASSSLSDWIVSFGVAYEVGLSGLCELLLGGRTDGGICEFLSASVCTPRRGIWRANVPGERVPARTWLTSMLGRMRFGLS